MKYELAKKLKDAGLMWGELIEACGANFKTLSMLETYLGKKFFKADSWGNYSEEYCFETPEEAVANLWLELNKKTNGAK